MSKYISQEKTELGYLIYPKTLEEAVFNSDGLRLNETLNLIRARLTRIEERLDIYDDGYLNFTVVE